MTGSRVGSPRGHQSPDDREHKDSHSKSERNDAYPALLELSGVISPPLTS
jgi:hypothetical protein